MRTLIFLTIISALFGLTACHANISPELPERSVLEHMLQNNPDSLATLLENEIDPFLLSDADRADYAFWLANAHKKQHRNLINDTLIFYTLDYYTKTDSPDLLKAYLLAADQANSSGKNILDMKRVLEEALHVAESKKDTVNFMEIVNRLSYYDVPQDNAELKELIQLTKRYSTEEWDIPHYINLVRLYERIDQPDSASLYNRKGMELSRKKNMNQWEQFFVRNEARFLTQQGKYKESVNLLRNLESRMKVGNEINFNYATNYINMGRLDSAQVHLDLMQQLVDRYRYEALDEIYMIDILLKIFHMTAKAKEGKPISIYDMGMAPDRLLMFNRNLLSADQERQFMQKKLLKDKLTLQIERGELRQRFLWGGIFGILAIAIMIFFYQRKLLNKQRFVQEAKEQLRLRSIQLSENASTISKNQELIKDLSEQLDENGDLKQEIDQLVAENQHLDEKNQLLQKDIEHYSKSMIRKDQELSVYEQLVHQNAKLEERERFLTAQVIAYTPVLDKLNKKPRFIEETQWPEIIHAVNQLFDGFSYRLHTSFPSLSEEDIRYCCLIKLRLSTSVMATLTGISPSSVTKRKQRIKEKMNQQRPTEFQKEQPLEIHLWNY